MNSNEAILSELAGLRQMIDAAGEAVHDGRDCAGAVLLERVVVVADELHHALVHSNAPDSPVRADRAR